MFSSIHIQGALISEELLGGIAEGGVAGQGATDFGLEPGGRLAAEIEYAWSRVRLEWNRFTAKRATTSPADPYGTAAARRWMEDFFTVLGFEPQRNAVSLTGSNGQSYAVSHSAGSPVGMPIHIVGYRLPDAPPGKEVNTLETRIANSRLSPHSLMQEYLNVTGTQLYGLLTNGLSLRLLRDSGRLTRYTYIEADLRRMIEGDQYADFVALYRLLHASRFGAGADGEGCWMEHYYLQSIATGNRIRNGLSAAVERALAGMGEGFLQHPANESLRGSITDGRLSAKDYYRLLLRTVYRLLFLLVTEERDLVYDPDDTNSETTARRDIYTRYYSLARLRRLATMRHLESDEHSDLWPALQATFRLFEEGGNGAALGIRPLGGSLFSRDGLGVLADCTLTNRVLLGSLRAMHEFEEGRTLTTINYRALDVEELGSVYEGLLDLHPVVDERFGFSFLAGTDRKTTASYYTRPDLVAELIKSALVPVIEERLKAHGTDRKAAADALLDLKVCDPAAGSGHILLAAARTIAWYHARAATGDENPAPSAFRHSLRLVIQHCIYAVDYNPDAVELCKLALWLESHESGKPLSFLDHKIRNGNSLVGVTDLSVLSRPLPDDAYNAVTGDDAAVCRALKGANRVFRKTSQGELFTEAARHVERDSRASAAGHAEIDAVEQNDLAAIARISRRYAEARHSVHHEETACNIWTAAFFKTYTDEEDLANPTSQRLADYFNAPTQYGKLAGEAAALAAQHRFFHWPLEFPDVWASGRFDVMLGNPPWERIKLQQQEFFATRDARIAGAANAAERARMIKALEQTAPELHAEYTSALHAADATGKFLRASGRCALTAVGDINTYSIFSEVFATLINAQGRAAFIVPTGIATDDSNKAFFGSLVNEKRLVSLYSFENEENIFPTVHHAFKFCLLTLSGASQEMPARFAFFLRGIAQLGDEQRTFELYREDFLRLNPNTKTCPIFRTRKDAELTAKIYSRVPVLVNEANDENPWGVKFSTMFHMSNDSDLFRTHEQLEEDGFQLWGNSMKRGEDMWLPLYEAKMIWHYNHRFGTYAGMDGRASTQTPTPTVMQYADASYQALPWYWVNAKSIPYMGLVPSIVEDAVRSGIRTEILAAVQPWIIGSLFLAGNSEDARASALEWGLIVKDSLEESFGERMKEHAATFPLRTEEAHWLVASKLEALDEVLEARRRKWFVGFRDVTNNTNERTAIFSVIPESGVGHTMPLVLVETAKKAALLVGLTASITFDAIARQKVSGMHLTYMYLKQLAFLEPETFTSSNELSIIPLVLELTYTSWDIKAFADDLWRDADEDLKAALRKQWAEAERDTGGHPWAPPAWSDAAGTSPETTDGIPLPPFRWDEARRARLRARLDALYARLYGLTTDELRYILDPQDVYGSAFPGETFRVLKEKEIRQLGEYRTKRLVMEEWEVLANGELPVAS